MKPITTLTLLLLCVHLSAQPVLTRSWFPGVGSSYVMTRADITGYTGAPASGTAAVWDYSRLSLTGLKDTISYLDTAGYYLQPGVNLISQGATGTTELEAGTDTVRQYRNRAAFITYEFPLGYGSDYMDSAINADAYTYEHMTRRVQAVGWGTLILPGADTVYDALELKIFTDYYSYSDNGPGINSSATSQTLSYQWLTATISNPVLTIGYVHTTSSVNGNQIAADSSQAISVLTSHHQVLAGISETSTTDAALIYPNPATNKIYIYSEKIQDVSTLQITDMTGRMISDIQINSTNTIDISLLSPGCYTITARDKNGSLRLTKKLVRE